MSEQYYGTIAALEFSAPSRHLFKAIVDDLDSSFQPFGIAKSSSDWLGDNVAVIERDSLRVLLGWLPSGCEREHCVLMFAVGHATVGGNILVPKETCEFVRDVLVSHLESYLQFDTVFRADATQPVDMNLLSTVAEILELGDAAAHQSETLNSDARPHRQARALTRDIVLRAKTPKKPAENAYEQFPEIIEVTEEDRIEQAEAHKELSLQKRLTIYALGATMLIYTPPVGATLLVYTTLRDFATPKHPERLAA